MSAKPLNEWNEQPDPVTLDYHLRQWTEPYRSTVHFAKFIEDRMSSTKWVVDAACGGGAPTAYLAETYPDAAFLGIDISKELIDIAHSKRLFSENLSFACEDICNPSPRFGVDAVTLQQALSWMPDYQEPLRQLCSRLHPKWLAFSTLVYDGDIDTKIVVTEHKRPRQAYYNIYGLPGIDRHMGKLGYQRVKAERFKIDVELRRPANPDFMQTWTSGDIQYSGPLYLPWCFVMYERVG